MNAAKSLIQPENVISEFTAEEIVESVVVSNINDSRVTIVDTLVQSLPESVQGDSTIQRIVLEIDRLEKTYLPLAQAIRNHGVLANPARYILALAGGLLLVGLAAGLSDLVGLLVALALIAALAFYIQVQRRAVQSLNEDTQKIKQSLVTKVEELKKQQAELVKEK